LAGVERPYDSVSPEPGITVVVCTRDRAASLRRCLRTLAALDHPNFEVVVVDNAPTTVATSALLAGEFADDPRFRHVTEPSAGLSRARNTGLAAARHDVVAFTDDDTLVDRKWLAALSDVFAHDDRVGCVTGLIPSAEFETAAQVHFDAKVSWSSSFDRVRYTLDMRPLPEPWFPFQAGRFGAGANFAVRRSALAAIGGFDVALGAGSASRGGEDLDLFVRVLRGGWALVYEPAAIVWHAHRVDAAGLRRQFFAYGLGFGAYAGKWLFHWETGPDLVRRAPAVLSRLASARKEAVGQHIPASLLAVELVGVAAGPLVYFRTRRRLRRTRRAAAGPASAPTSRGDSPALGAAVERPAPTSAGKRRTAVARVPEAERRPTENGHDQATHPADHQATRQQATQQQATQQQATQRQADHQAAQAAQQQATQTAGADS
jgi:GT2 family glycosyltransferase